MPGAADDRAVSGKRPVKRRLVLAFPGYEPLPVEAHCRRFARELARAAPFYGMTADVSDAELAPARPGGVPTGRIAVDATGEGWRTHSEIIVYGLGSVNEAYASRRIWARIASGFHALADFTLTGTLWRYLRTSWRYGFFFAYPLILTVLAICAVLAIAWAAAGSGAVWVLAAFLIGLCGAIWALCRATHYLLTLDHWTFARDAARCRRPQVQSMLRSAVKDAVARIRASNADEVVVATHSFGAIAGVQAVAEVLRDAERSTADLGLMTTGSSLLTIALHPAANDYREAVAEVARGCGAWLDVQSLTDVVNFHRSNPASSLQVIGAVGPNAMSVRFRHQLEPRTYRAIRRDFFRVHRQFVMAVERRSPYSYHAILCGPEPFADVAARGGLADGWSYP